MKVRDFLYLTQPDFSHPHGRYLILQSDYDNSCVVYRFGEEISQDLTCCDILSVEVCGNFVIVVYHEVFCEEV